MDWLSVKVTPISASAVLVVLDGELDIASVPELRECFERVAADAPKRVVVDLSRLGFCDCSGLGVFLEWHQRAHDAGFEFELGAPSRTVRHLLDLTGVADVLNVSDGLIASAVVREPPVRSPVLEAAADVTSGDDVGRCRRCGRWQRRRHAYVEDFGPSDREEWCATGNCSATWASEIELVLAAYHVPNTNDCRCRVCIDASYGDAVLMRRAADTGKTMLRLVADQPVRVEE